ncbi:heme NO-binding domain-containing protein [Maritimibacter harenae]|uniref:heme NO-binding domain-containing protein n=1 Tax=Maritimibacter harenae TaxID=2606218 RepID=UPI001F31B9A1|nr:heme NO-binding domain-containing protein [Maritimibacter harenae]
MHGIVCRSFETFVKAAYGPSLWRELTDRLDMAASSFEPMFHYDDGLVLRLVTLCAERLGKPREVLLEDFGTDLVAGFASGRVRRLLRYCGIDYADFLHALDDLPGRVALAVPDIGLPELELTECGPGRYRLACRSRFPGAAHVITGLLRALANEYGALAVLDCAGREGDAEVIDIHLLQEAFAEARGFDLSDTLLAVGGRDA